MSSLKSLAWQLASRSPWSKSACLRSAELMQTNAEVRRALLDAVQQSRALRAKAGATRAESARLRASLADAIPHRVVARPPRSVLTGTMLLELAAEFGDMAKRAATTESAAAFQDLMFRYTALANGSDTNVMDSRYVH
jgi:hypothetical protein